MTPKLKKSIMVAAAALLTVSIAAGVMPESLGGEEIRAALREILGAALDLIGSGEPG